MPGDRRRALMRGLMAQLLRYEHIKTTEARAKELRPRIERLVTLGKRGDLHARRLALSYLPDKLMIEKLFSDVAPRYAERQGGYTRIIKIGRRKGDAAEVVQVELV
ncbi:MAG TPA: 50S ribosomal protein L17 [Chloroflexota bacterium]|nr:50S ribosomal protein L17 [Chloroflexota bacterium]